MRPLKLAATLGLFWIGGAIWLYARAEQPLAISWTNNVLTISDRRLPGGQLEVWYPEAFCRKGAFGRDWKDTTLGHKTVLTKADPKGQRLEFRTSINPEVELRHEIQASSDELDLRFEFENKGSDTVDLQWFEPACIRAASFTGCSQSNYTGQSFIFASGGLTRLDQLHRTLDAHYVGGQVYLPQWVSREDSNPRPVCLDHPVNGLIGCFSADNRWILATASDQTHELFEGVYVCLHSDPRLDGLAPGQIKRRRSKIYLMPSDPSALLARYRRDFPESRSKW